MDIGKVVSVVQAESLVFPEGSQDEFVDEKNHYLLELVQALNEKDKEFAWQ